MKKWQDFCLAMLDRDKSTLGIIRYRCRYNAHRLSQRQFFRDHRSKSIFSNYQIYDDSVRAHAEGAPAISY